MSRSLDVKRKTTPSTLPRDQQRTRVELTELLRTKGLKASKQRLAILKAFHKVPCPAAAEEVYRALPPKTCDLATLYRTIGHLERVGMLRKLQLGENSARFEMIEGHQHHHHVVCRSCHRIEAVDFCGLKDLENQVAQKGFRNLTHSLEFFGICSRC